MTSEHKNHAGFVVGLVLIIVGVTMGLAGAITLCVSKDCGDDNEAVASVARAMATSLEYVVPG